VELPSTAAVPLHARISYWSRSIFFELLLSPKSFSLAFLGCHDN